jgi:beta-glucosidase-like glycosyl hydrolase
MLALIVLQVARSLRPNAAGPVLHANTCSNSSVTQKWDFSHTDGEIQQHGTNQLCVDIDGYSTANMGTLQVFACHPKDKNPEHQNQAWSMDAAAKTIKATGSAKGKCIDVSNFGSDGSGSIVWTYDCTGTANQQWSYDATTGMLHSLQTGSHVSLCLDSGAVPPPPRPCSVAANANLPWCDSTLPTEVRLKDLVDRILPEEIVGLFSNGDGGVPSMHIPRYQWWSEALHGVGHSPGVTFSGDTPNATSFPQVITTGSTFNNTLFGMIGDAISTEARAFNNVGHAGNTFWTPNVNIFRDPRWGRGQETPGEDPTHNADYAAHFVPGMQGGVAPKYIKASSCLKHYFAYNLENWGGVDRHHFNAIVDEQDLVDTYLPPFQSGVQRGNASGLMCSYNAVNGVPSCANKPYLNGVLREKWGFDGYVTSDCGAVNDVQNNHKYTHNGDNTSFVVLDAGMDIDCGGFLGQNLGKAIADGAVTKATWGTALTNLFRVRMRVGQFDPVKAQPYLAYGLDKIDTPAHQELALEAAKQGVVLLKNTAATLPLDAAAIETVAVVGPLADNGAVLLGNYEGTPPYEITVAAGVGAEGVAVTTVPGVPSVSSTDTSGIAAAVAAAKGAQATIIVAGLDQSQESEGHDRTVLTMPGAQNELIAAVAAAAKGPVVLVLLCGGAVDVSAHVANAKIGAILWAGYPGQSGGAAIGETLFGRNNPSGKLTQTWCVARWAVLLFY